MGSKLVLLVDDEELAMSYYVRALKRKGFEVKQCYDPDEALLLVEKDHPDLAAISVDIMMPSGRRYSDRETNQGLRSGILLYHELRRHYPETPVVILTHVSTQETLDEFPPALSVKVLQKLDMPPADFAILIDELTN